MADPHTWSEAAVRLRAATAVPRVSPSLRRRGLPAPLTAVPPPPRACALEPWRIPLASCARPCLWPLPPRATSPSPPRDAPQSLTSTVTPPPARGPIPIISRRPPVHPASCCWSSRVQVQLQVMSASYVGHDSGAVKVEWLHRLAVTCYFLQSLFDQCIGLTYQH